MVQESNLRQPTVLVVDDEPALLNLMILKLRRMGWQVHSATSATAALEIADRLACQLNLLVTDIQMPGMPGDELIRCIRKACPFVDVLAITGALPEHAHGLPNVPFLQKPFPMAHLVEAASDILATQL
jgi:CheY-like chemotaxis protein